jgi:hypothetical protein
MEQSKFPFSWTAKERRVLRQLQTPMDIQLFLDSLLYSEEERYRCPRSVLRDRKGHCYDGAVLAAAAMRELGFPPLIMELIPNRRDDDHIIVPFRTHDRWGAVAKSNYTGLRYREPVYHSLRELAMSYFEGYFNMARERTLRAFGAPLRLARFDRIGWQMHDAAMDAMATALGECRRFPILTKTEARRLTAVDPRTFQAGVLGLRKAGVFRVKP